MVNVLKINSFFNTKLKLRKIPSLALCHTQLTFPSTIPHPQIPTPFVIPRDVEDEIGISYAVGNTRQTTQKKNHKKKAKNNSLLFKSNTFTKQK